MARREVGEINAGSMADIAFLLLIFFLVTTTMEVDAGIGRVLPQKLDIDFPPQPPVHDRNILVIMANNEDRLLVEGEPMELEDLEDKVREYFMDNMDGVNHNPDMPMWTRINAQIVQQELAKIQAAIDASPDDVFIKKEYAKWEKKLEVCNEVGGEYMEIHKSAIIQLKNQSQTSYGLYIEIQNILKKVVNELRQKKCDELGWGEYLSLSLKEPEDMAKIELLRIMVPERIIEAKIER